MFDSFTRFSELHLGEFTCVSVPSRPSMGPADTGFEGSYHFVAHIFAKNGTVFWTGHYSVGAGHVAPWAKGCKSHVVQMAMRRIYNPHHLPNPRTVNDAKEWESIVSAFKRHAPIRMTDVLESLQADWRDHELTFIDWGENLGYGADSITAKNIYDMCQNGAKIARDAVGRAVFEKFLEIEPE